MVDSGLKDTTAAKYERYVQDDFAPFRLGTVKLADPRRAHINAFAAELIAVSGMEHVRIFLQRCA